MRRFAKYGGVAAGSAAVDWVIFATLFALGLNYLVVQLISRIGGGVFSFVMNKFWSFEVGSKGRVTVQGRRFLLLYGFSYVLSLTLLYIQVDVLGENAYISKLIGDGTVFVVNFIVMQGYVFKDRDGLSRGVRRLVRALRRTA